MSERPVIRLKPKADARRLRHGHPWAHADDLVLDRRTRGLSAGTIVTLEDAERRAIGTFAFNPGAAIAARALDRDPQARIDRDWLAGRLDRALALREALHDSPHYRLVHAEGDGLPGLVIDRFGAALAIQPNAAWIEALLPDLVDVLCATTGATLIVKNAGGRARAQEGLDDESAILLGRAEGPLDVPMNGAVYRADLTGGQKTGLFYDQRPNHAFDAGLAAGTRVLDVFSHVGGFALAALAAGATGAIAVDGSEPALALAREGAERSGTAARFEAYRADAFAALEQLGAEGERFGTVVCDPPAFAPAKAALEKGLRAYERVARLAAPLVAPGGTLTLCSCSHAATLEKFQAASTRGIGRAGREAALVRTGFAGPDHPVHAALGGQGYLKALTFRLA